MLKSWRKYILHPLTIGFLLSLIVIFVFARFLPRYKMHLIEDAKLNNNGKVYYLDWMEEFNELRRVPAHSSSMRIYDEDQYSFLGWLNTELAPRLDEAEL